MNHPSLRRPARVPNAVLLAAVLALGCHHGASHEEAEHHTPDHKPVSFPAAVERLTELHREVLNETQRRPDDDIDVFVELYDVVRWLPELAADSEASKETWDRVDAAARVFETKLDLVLAASELDGRAVYREQQVAIDKHLQELAALAKQFPADEVPEVDGGSPGPS